LSVEKPQEEKLPPPRTIPEHVTIRQSFSASYEKVFAAVTRALKDQKLGPSVANRERGVINTTTIKLTEAQVRERVIPEDARKARGNGYAIVSFWLHPLEGKTEVGIDALIAVNDEAESPSGSRSSPTEPWKSRSWWK
jgi:hypothetical protein